MNETNNSPLWSIDGGITWNNGNTSIQVPPSTYQVTFKAVDGYITPASQYAVVTLNNETVISAHYTYTAAGMDLYDISYPGLSATLALQNVPADLNLQGQYSTSIQAGNWGYNDSIYLSGVAIKAVNGKIMYKGYDSGLNGNWTYAIGAVYPDIYYGYGICDGKLYRIGKQSSGGTYIDILEATEIDSTSGWTMLGAGISKQGSNASISSDETDNYTYGIRNKKLFSIHDTYVTQCSNINFKCVAGAWSNTYYDVTGKLNGFAISEDGNLYSLWQNTVTQDSRLSSLGQRFDWVAGFSARRSSGTEMFPTALIVDGKLYIFNKNSGGSNYIQVGVDTDWTRVFTDGMFSTDKNYLSDENFTVIKAMRSQTPPTPPPTPTSGTISVVTPVSISGLVNTALDDTALSGTASNGENVYFELSAGSSLPTGVNMTSGGIINGTPTNVGTSSTAVLAKASNCENANITVNFNILNPAPPTPSDGYIQAVVDYDMWGGTYILSKDDSTATGTDRTWSWLADNQLKKAALTYYTDGAYWKCKFVERYSVDQPWEYGQPMEFAVGQSDDNGNFVGRTTSTPINSEFPAVSEGYPTYWIGTWGGRPAGMGGAFNLITMTWYEEESSSSSSSSESSSSSSSSSIPEVYYVNSSQAEMTFTLNLCPFLHNGDHCWASGIVETEEDIWTTICIRKTDDGKWRWQTSAGIDYIDIGDVSTNVIPPDGTYSPTDMGATITVTH